MASQTFWISYSQLRAVQLLKFSALPTPGGRAGFTGLSAVLGWDTAGFMPPWKLLRLHPLGVSLGTPRTRIQLLRAVNQTLWGVESHQLTLSPDPAQPRWFSIVSLSWFLGWLFPFYFKQNGIFFLKCWKRSTGTTAWTRFDWGGWVKLKRALLS